MYCWFSQLELGRQSFCNAKVKVIRSTGCISQPLCIRHMGECRVEVSVAHTLVQNCSSASNYKSLVSRWIFLELTRLAYGIEGHDPTQRRKEQTKATTSRYLAHCLFMSRGEAWLPWLARKLTLSAKTSKTSSSSQQLSAPLYRMTFFLSGDLFTFATVWGLWNMTSSQMDCFYF